MDLSVVSNFVIYFCIVSSFAMVCMLLMKILLFRKQIFPEAEDLVIFELTMEAWCV